ncbi:hypothetical protein IWW34DRAFT_795232 [Fusarium oxysporum f. sp. albedinis]|nr:hypothetical protein IWW34DRAFT_795232 [Fusarium oxysporum f. sp. albedinis]
MPKLSCSVKLLVFKTLFQSPLYSVFTASKEIVDRDKDVVKTPVSNLSGVWESSDDLFSRNASRCLKSNVPEESHVPGTERAVLTRPHFGAEGVISDWPKIARLLVMLQPQHHCITLVNGPKAYSGW